MAGAIKHTFNFFADEVEERTTEVLKQVGLLDKENVLPQLLS
jgi:ABC-type ATPase involved in cell division